MHSPADHFLLYTEASRSEHGASRWKFVLQSVAGDERFAAADSELDARRGRLELLAVVRGLEAIDRPSRVTLLTGSRYVSQGLRRQLNYWREDRWQWERFGELVPIRDHDLWRRVDRALEFHQVECCECRLDDRAAENWQAISPRSTIFSRAPGSRFFRVPRRGTFIAAALAKLRRGILTPFSAFWRPTFTQAA